MTVTIYGLGEWRFEQLWLSCLPSHPCLVLGQLFLHLRLARSSLFPLFKKNSSHPSPQALLSLCLPPHPLPCSLPNCALFSVSLTASPDCLLALPDFLWVPSFSCLSLSIRALLHRRGSPLRDSVLPAPSLSSPLPLPAQSSLPPLPFSASGKEWLALSSLHSSGWWIVGVSVGKGHLSCCSVSPSGRLYRHSVSQHTPPPPKLAAGQRGSAL